MGRFIQGHQELDVYRLAFEATRIFELTKGFPILPCTLSPTLPRMGDGTQGGEEPTEEGPEKDGCGRHVEGVTYKAVDEDGGEASCHPEP